MIILPDLLAPNLKIIFCGTAPGTQSARAKAYYAGRGNRFWKTLYEIGLTPRQLMPQEYPELLLYGLGLTDLSKTSFGQDETLSFSNEDRESLKAKIERYQPQILAFTSKNAGQQFLKRPVCFGLQDAPIGKTKVFVLPSTSGLAIRYWNIQHWKKLVTQ